MLTVQSLDGREQKLCIVHYIMQIRIYCEENVERYDSGNDQDVNMMVKSDYVKKNALFFAPKINIWVLSAFSWNAQSMICSVHVQR